MYSDINEMQICLNEYPQNPLHRDVLLIRDNVFCDYVFCNCVFCDCVFITMFDECIFCDCMIYKYMFYVYVL